MSGAWRGPAASIGFTLAWGLARPDLLGVLMVGVGVLLLPHAGPTIGRAALVGVGVQALAARWLIDAWADFGSGSGLGPWLALAVLQAPTTAALVWIAHRRPDVAPLAAAALEALAGVIHPIPMGPVPVLTAVPALLAPAALLGRPAIAALLVASATRPGGPPIAAAWLTLGLLWTALDDDGPRRRVAVVQPQVGAFDGRRASTADRRAERLIAAVDGVGPVDLVVTPEGAWPFPPGGETGAQRRALLTAWAGRPPVVLGVESERGNHLISIVDGAVTGVLTKRALVPLAETPVFGFGKDRYDAGPADAEPLAIGGLNVGGLICYEDVLPAIVGQAAAKADVLVAATNDAWLGPGPGLDWHLAASRLAAVTTGLWVLRPTTSGRSAVIDDRGRLVWSAGWVDGDRSDVLPAVWVGDVPASTPATGARFAAAAGLAAAAAATLIAVGGRPALAPAAPPRDPPAAEA